MKLFTEKSFECWTQFVCGSCKHLAFKRVANAWVCDLGRAVTKEYCDEWVDDTENIRVKVPDGCIMSLRPCSK